MSEMLQAFVPPVHRGAFIHTENKLYRFADDSTLVAVMPSTGEREAVAESLKRDRNRVGMWCDLWVMKLYASKSKTMIVSRSRIIRPQSTPLTLDGTVLKVFDVMVISGVTFAAKMTMNPRRLVSRAAVQRLVII